MTANPVGIFNLLLLLLAVAVLLSVIADKLKLPPAIPLVMGGIVLALIPGLPVFQFEPSLIFVLFLPPLLLYAAYFTVWADFRADLRPITLLSLGAVAFTTASVGAVAHWLTPSLSWPACFTLGAIVSPPDAVSARAVFERLKIPRRVQTILEGESLVNDASGLILYRFAVAAALSGELNVVQASLSFVWVIVGGIATGLAIGSILGVILHWLRESRYVVVATLLAAYGCYIFAEEIHSSGVLAVVACGLLVGWRQHDLLSAAGRSESHTGWDLVVFILETLVFVLIGLSLHDILGRLNGHVRAWDQAIPLAVGSVLAVVISRFIWIFAAGTVRRILEMRKAPQDPLVSTPLLTLMSWAGMRGVVSLAAALALPLNFPGRDAILFATFTVIVATVLLQGLTLRPLIEKLRLPEAETHPEAKETLSFAQTRVKVAEAAVLALETMVKSPESSRVHRNLLDEYRRRMSATERLRDEDETINAESHEHFQAALAATQESRAELLRLLHAGEVHEAVAHEIEAELDLEEIRWEKLAQAVPKVDSEPPSEKS